MLTIFLNAIIDVDIDCRLKLTMCSGSFKWWTCFIFWLLGSFCYCAQKHSCELEAAMVRTTADAIWLWVWSLVLGSIVYFIDMNHSNPFIEMVCALCLFKLYLLLLFTYFQVLSLTYRSALLQNIGLVCEMNKIDSSKLHCVTGGSTSQFIDLAVQYTVLRGSGGDK